MKERNLAGEISLDREYSDLLLEQAGIRQEAMHELKDVGTISTRIRLQMQRNARVIGFGFHDLVDIDEVMPYNGVAPSMKEADDEPELTVYEQEAIEEMDDESDAGYQLSPSGTVR